MMLPNRNGFTVAVRQQMNEKELTDVLELEKLCSDFEGLKLKLNWGMLRERQDSGESNDFLCYDGEGKLIGFLALYGFGRPEIEVNGMVHPSFRRKGVFAALLERAAAECGLRGISSFLFICERKSESGMNCLRSIGTTHDHSEYRMELPGTMPLLQMNHPVELRAAAASDYEMLAELDSICFGIPLEESRNFYTENALLSTDRLFVAALNGEDIGMIKLSRENDEIYVFGFGIKPEYRGRGYGRAVLGKAVNLALADKPEKVTLEVDCVNDTALNLYRSCGFQLTATYDYFRLPTEI